MAIIKQYHADTDTTYVYESVSYWDAEKRQSRSKRKLLGKLDPETGDIIPTGSRGRKKKTSLEPVSTADTGDLELQIKELTLRLKQQDEQIAALEQENDRLKDILKRTAGILDRCADIVRPFV